MMGVTRKEISALAKEASVLLRNFARYDHELSAKYRVKESKRQETELCVTGWFGDEGMTDSRALKKKLFSVDEPSTKKRSRQSNQIFDHEKDCSICLLDRNEGGSLYSMPCCGAIVHLKCAGRVVSMRYMAHRCTACHKPFSRPDVEQILKDVKAKKRSKRSATSSKRISNKSTKARRKVFDQKETVDQKALGVGQKIVQQKEPKRALTPRTEPRFQLGDQVLYRAALGTVIAIKKDLYRVHFHGAKPARDGWFTEENIHPVEP
ncbi:hypothetical protein AAMO2058_000795400 [Amorphochlora amoebiformis]